jgi:hypothetical protein
MSARHAMSQINASHVLILQSEISLKTVHVGINTSRVLIIVAVLLASFPVLNVWGLQLIQPVLLVLAGVEIQQLTVIVS